MPVHGLRVRLPLGKDRSATITPETTERRQGAYAQGRDGGVMKSIRELFPLASAATVAANPQMLASNVGKVKPKVSWVCKDGMNKTEYQYSLILEEMKKRREILRYEYEGITLRWADMRYTPDFVAFTNVMQMLKQMGMIKSHEFATVEWSGMKLIEVKGGHIWDRDIVRFKGARAYWPEFAFEMHQKTKQGWKRKY